MTYLNELPSSSADCYFWFLVARCSVVASDGNLSYSNNSWFTICTYNPDTRYGMVGHQAWYGRTPGMVW